MMNSLNSILRGVPTWALYLIGLLPFVWLVSLLFTGGLGVDPVKGLERQIGKISLQFLVAGLAITPLRKLIGLNLLKFRRPVGLLTFFYVSTHLAVWLALDIQFYWGEIWADIIKRPYITIGMGAFVLMVPLALTSNNRSLRRLGPLKWRKLHKLVYLIGLAGAVHYVMVVKGWQVQPFAYLAGVSLLLAARIRFSGFSKPKRA